MNAKIISNPFLNLLQDLLFFDPQPNNQSSNNNNNNPTLLRREGEGGFGEYLSNRGSVDICGRTVGFA